MTTATKGTANIYVSKGSRGGFVAATHVMQLHSLHARKSLRGAMKDAETIRTRLAAMGYDAQVFVK